MASTNGSILITGANAGIGRELARQLGERPGIGRVVLGCRSVERGEAAAVELREETGRDVFEVLEIDVADLASVRTAVTELGDPVDALVMNAGGTGGPHPDELTADGVTAIAAVNLVGHALLLDELVARGQLRRVALMVGSEAARGVRKLRMPRPSFKRYDADEFADVLDGSYYDDFDGAAAYGDVKYLAALWIGAAARKQPGLRLATVSPGGTRGTHLAHDMGQPMQFIYDHVLMGIVARRVTHTVDVAADRLAWALDHPSFAGGRFYASDGDTLTGPVVDQAAIQPDFADPMLQDAAAEAVSRYTGSLAGIA